MDLEGTGYYPIIPNIKYFKDSLIKPVDGGNEKVIHIPEGAHYQEIELSPAKVFIGTFVLFVGAGLYKLGMESSSSNAK